MGDQAALEEHLTRAGAALGAAAATPMLAEDPSERAAIEELARFVADLRQLAIEALVVSPEGAPALREPQELFASRGVPRPHGTVVIDAPEVLPLEPPWDDGDEVDDDLAPSPLVEPQSPDLLERASLARGAMEDLASLGTLRTLYDHEPWGQAEAFEERLLAAYDYLVAQERPHAGSFSPASSAEPPLGVARRLHRYATDFTVPDAGRSFALAFFLSSVAPHAARAWLAIAIRRAHDRTLEAYVDALSLGASDEVVDVCAALVSDGERPALLALALDVLWRRRRAPEQVLLSLAAHPDPAIVARAARGLALARPEIAGPVLSRLLDAPPEVAAAALESLAVLGAQMVPAFARDVAGGDGPLADRALVLLAMLGGGRDKDALFERALARPELLSVVARVGTVGQAERLVGALAAETDEGRRQHLERVLEALLGPLSPTPRDALARVGSVKDLRIRHGRPFGGADGLVGALAEPATQQGDRRFFVRELSILKRTPVPFDVDGWVAAQRAALGR
jgi:hypothetical protein